MSAEPHRRVSLEGYLAAERQAETRNEYLNGDVFAMSGASREHNLIVWSSRVEETVSLGSIGCTLRLADIYERVPGSSSDPLKAR